MDASAAMEMFKNMLLIAKLIYDNPSNGGNSTVSTVWTLVFSTLLSGLVAAIISIIANVRQQDKKIKLDLASDIFGYRYQMGKNDCSCAEFLKALNRVPIIFSKNKNVIKAYKEYRSDMTDDRLFKLMEEICDAVNIDRSEWDEKTIKNAFVENRD